MSVEIIKTADQEIAQQITRLLGYLTDKAPLVTKADLEVILSDNSLVIFGYYALEESRGLLQGMLTLVTYRLLSGQKAWVEDVVVDPLVQGQGIGRKLVKASQTYAKEHNLGSIDLTSRPQRQAANHLYQTLGFVRRDTNVYRWTCA